MECPRCRTADISVIDSRDCDADAIRRRRQCDGCNFRFTTYERIEPVKLTVRKRTGGHEPYQRNKILRGLTLATEKRNITAQELEAMVDRIEMKILMCVEDQLTSNHIGEYVMHELRKVDEVAYLRFASVYRSFESLEAFEQELAKIRKKTG